MKRVLGLVLAGLVGAGTLFSGVGVAHAEGEAKQEQLEDVVLEQNSEEVINDQVDAGGGLSSSEEEMETSGENDAKEGVQEKVLSSVNDEFKILRFTADKTEVNPGDAITFSLETTDNTKVDNVYAKFTSEDGNDSLGVFIYNDSNSSSLVQTEQITNTYAGKTFTLRSISVEDGWGGELFSSNDVIPEIGNLSIKVGEVTDTSAPEIQSITLDKESVKPGENITVTIDATDLSGLDYNNLGEYSVTFVRETDDEEMLFNINSGSDGKFIATNEISNKDKNGKYILKSISGPKDVAGNCFNAETHEESRYIGELSFEIVDSDESTEGWVIKNGSESLVSYGKVIHSNENENIYFDEETATLHLKDFKGQNIYYMYYSEETESHPVGADYSKGKTLTLNLSGNNTVQKLSNHYNQYDEYDTGLDKLVIAGDGTLNIDLQNSLGSAIGINSGNFVVNSGTINIQLPNEGGIGITNHNRDDDNNYEFNGGVLNINAPEKSLTNRRYGIIVNGGTMKVSNAEININLGVKVNGRRDGLAEVEVLGIDIGSMGIKHLDDGDIERYPIGGKLILDNAHIKILAGEAYQICCTEIEDLSKNHRYYIGKTAASKEVKFSEAFDKRNEIGYEQLMRDSYDVNDNPNAGWHYLEITQDNVELVPVEDDIPNSNGGNNQYATTWADFNTEAHYYNSEGLEVTLATDKQEYQMGEIVTEVLAVKNISDETIEKVKMNVDIPEGFEILNDSVDIRKVENLEPGETETLVVYYRKNMANAGEESEHIETNTTDRVHVSTGNTKKVNSASTGDNNKAWIWGIVAGAAAVGMIVAIKKKRSKKIILFFLVAAMSSSMLSMGVQSVDAEEIQNDSVTDTEDDSESTDGVLVVQNDIIYDGENINLIGKAAAYNGFKDQTDRANVVYLEGVYETDVEYEIDDNKEVIYINNSETIKDWKIGEIHVLTNSDNYLAIKIEKIEEIDGKSAISYSIPQLGEVFESVDIVQHKNEFSFTPAENVEVVYGGEVANSTAVRDTEIDYDSKNPYRVRRSVANNNNVKKVEENLSVQSIDRVAKTNPNKYVDEPGAYYKKPLDGVFFEVKAKNKNGSVKLSIDPEELVFGLTGQVNKKGEFNFNEFYSYVVCDADIKGSLSKEFEAPILLGKVSTGPIVYGFGCSANLYMVIGADSKASFVLKWDDTVLGLDYGNNKGLKGITDNLMPQISYEDSISGKVGLQMKPSIDFCFVPLTSLETKAECGLEISGKLKQYYDGNCLPIEVYDYYKAGISVPVALPVGINEVKAEIKKEKVLVKDAEIHIEFPPLKIVGKCTRGTNKKTTDGKDAKTTNNIPKANTKTVTKSSSSSSSQQKVTGNFKLTIVNSSGKIIPNASVELYQTNDAIINGKKGNDTRVNLSKDSSGAYFCNLKSGQSYGLKNLVLPSGYSNPNLNQYFDAFIRLDYTKNRTYDGLVCTSVVGNDPKRTAFSKIVQITDSNSKDGRVEIKIKV